MDDANPPLRFKLRLLTQNLWHGLDHTRPYTMWPTENLMKRWLRNQSHTLGLKALREPPAQEGAVKEDVLEVFCLQEVNPVRRKTEELKRALGMEGYGAGVNVGIRAGDISYPVFLQEGLAILWQGAFTKIETDHRILSGHAPEMRAPLLDIPITLQLAERRGAVLVSGEWAGKRFTFVTLHLHNGPPNNKEHSARRAREIDLLMEWIDPWLQSSDAVFVLGDFNAERGDAELASLVSAGFQEVLTPLGDPIVTWDPTLNPIARASLARTQDPQEKEWDSRQHQIDHIFYRVKGKSWGKREDSRPPWTFRIERIFDQPQGPIWPSDHFGLLTEISWTLR
ncbi:MAG: endonuclease/exonuclease/phosphatase family protein [Bdellovibrionales bacterium]|nr:endonuclease/exonuclease/phosphatase family protein [Bdellovibrionales bacterium]